MIFKIALKNMFKNKKRTILTIFSITISSIFMFTFLFLFSSYKKNLYDKAVYNNGREHLIISNYKYNDLNAKYKTVESNYTTLSTEYDDFKKSKMTDDEK